MNYSKNWDSRLSWEDICKGTRFAGVDKENRKILMVQKTDGQVLSGTEIGHDGDGITYESDFSMVANWFSELIEAGEIELTKDYNKAVEAIAL